MMVRSLPSRSRMARPKVKPAGGSASSRRVVQGGEQLGGRESAGVMARAGDFGEPDGLQPDELGPVGQPGQQPLALGLPGGRIRRPLGGQSGGHSSSSGSGGRTIVWSNARLFNNGCPN
jgi:hypothetical protein